MSWKESPVWYCTCRKPNPREQPTCLECGREKHLYLFPFYERAFHREEPNYRFYRDACPRKTHRGIFLSESEK
jgi:hypothetical protein